MVLNAAAYYIIFFFTHTKNATITFLCICLDGIIGVMGSKLWICVLDRFGAHGGYVSMWSTY